MSSSEDNNEVGKYQIMNIEDTSVAASSSHDDRDESSNNNHRPTQSSVSSGGGGGGGGLVAAGSSFESFSVGGSDTGCMSCQSVKDSDIGRFKS